MRTRNAQVTLQRTIRKELQFRNNPLHALTLFPVTFATFGLWARYTLSERTPHLRLLISLFRILQIERLSLTTSYLGESS